MFKRFGALVAIITFAMSANLTSAISVPINANAGASAVTPLQQTVSDFANGAAHIVASIEVAIGSIVGEIADRLTGVDPSKIVLSNTAAAAVPATLNPVTARSLNDPTTSITPDSAPLPPSITPPVAPAALNSRSASTPAENIFQLQSELSQLTMGVRSLTALLQAQTPFSKIEGQIAALQSAISSQGYYNSVAAVPLGGGPVNTIAAASAIDQLSGVAITNSSIDTASLPDLSGKYLSIGSTSTARSTLGLQYATAADLTMIAAWGDSLTYGAGGTSYPSQLANLLGVPVYNGGVNGYTSSQIAAAMLAATSTYSDPTIIWAGRNDITGSLSTDEPIIQANIASMVAALQTAGNTHYLIMSILNSSTEPSGSLNYSEIIQINADLSATYGSHYWDVRSFLVSQYNPSLPQDVVDYGNDVPPSSLRAEPLHPGNAGNLKIAQWLEQHSSLLFSSSANVAVLTTQNLSLLLTNPFSFSSLDTVSGYTQGGNVVLSLFPNDQSLAIGAANAAAWMAATSSYFYDTALGIGALKTAPTSGGAVNNTALGANTLTNNTSGAYNTATGEGGLYSNTSGALNTANGVLSLYYNTTGGNNAAFGVGTLYRNTTGSFNTSVGTNALNLNNTGSFNTGVGYAALINATSSSNNTAVGYQAMDGSTTGSLTISGTNNTAVGFQALPKFIDGSNNIAIGYQAMTWATTSKNSVAIGVSAGGGNSTNDNYQGLVALGYKSGVSLSNGSDYNTLIGYQAGYGITTGSNNIWIGSATSSTGIANLTTGSQNILIGNNISLASSTASGQINMGNILFGTGVTGTGTKVSGGNLGIGTTTPYSRLEVWGLDTASTSAFTVVNNASTTEFAVLDNGNATLAGNLIQNSDQRLKTNVTDLDASSSLAAINALSPVTFNWIDPAKGSVPQFGFIAQQVQSVFPSLVSVTAPTSLTPDGTLSLNYIDLISPIVAAIQQLDKEITSLTSMITGFADGFTTKQLTFVRGQGDEIDVQKLCIGSTCVTEAQLRALLAAANQSPVAPSSTSEATGTSPIIAINGHNPAVVQVGASYSDLGAIITGPQADLNLGVRTFVNGLFVSNIQLDTSAVATDTIDYVVTDANGLTSTSTRTVIIEAANDNQASSASANNNAASTTLVASTAQ
jgi:lysophospholipase L1-like esterase